MFSYLRPHRRTPSNPTSPVPEQSHSWEPPVHPLDHAHPQRYHDAASQDSPTNLTAPPSLPPATRVSSAGHESTAGNRGGSRPGLYERDQRRQYWEASRGDTQNRDIKTFSNHPRIPAAGMQRPESAGNTAPMKNIGFQHSRPQPSFYHEVPTRPPPQPPSEQGLPSDTSADLQTRPVHTGRRPTGARLPTPPPSASNHVSTYESIQPRSGKARLNLLNPMSLLARRRTPQAISQLSAESISTNRTNHLPATFDPRIRGTVVHDFSAPRAPPRRNVSQRDVGAVENANNAQGPYPRSPNPQYIESSSDDGPDGLWSGGNHTPVFTENFEEEQYPAAGPHVRRASDLSDLPLPKPPYAKGAQKPIDQNSPLKSNEASQRQDEEQKRLNARKPVGDVGPPVPPKVQGEVLQPRRISIDPAATQPKSARTSKRGLSRNVSDVSAKDGGTSLPKHMESTSSRFSFDMIGAVEQERLLEDRHRQRALERKSEKGDVEEEEDEGDYEYDDMMDDDGLEERIPGVNADLEEEDEYFEKPPDDDDGLEEAIPGLNVEAEAEEEEEFSNDSQNMAGFIFRQSSLSSPLSPYTPGMVSTPRDANGEVIGFAFTKDSPYLPMVQDSSVSSPLSPDARLSAVGTGIQGLGLQGVETSGPTEVRGSELEPDQTDFPHASCIEDDDLYFDDGIIDELGDGEEAMEFDESVFDNVDTDQYGRPLKAFSSLPTLYSPPVLSADPSPSFNKIPEVDENTLKSPDVPDSAVSPGTIPPAGALAPKPSVIGHQSTAPSQTLTQDTLAAYQSALAEAAYVAAANGKFNWRDSTTPDALSPSFQDEAHPGLIPDSSQTSHYEPFSPSYELEDDLDYDALSDDPIIAAANAEALANDCDGFYGQEFGFYSAPAASEAEYANGGYFGPRGLEGVNRSTSGRVASREPNLTPITERSEYSNRNSFMSLSMHGSGSVASPGLALLAGMLSSQDYEGDMSLNALLKLRRGAWGGSQASLHSSSGSPKSAGAEDVSPVGGLPPWAQGGAVNMPDNPAVGKHRRQNSNLSIGALSEVEVEGEGQEGVVGVESGGESPESLTLAISSPTSAAPPPPVSPASLPSPQDRHPDLNQNSKENEDRAERNTTEGGLKRHRYTGSAESISYLKEDDPLSPTGNRWVLERRRTAESGEVEILGREVVSGGRI